MSLFNDASLIITPNGVKAGKLYALKGADLDVVRATSATRVNASGLIELVSANVPRLDYSNGSCPSILVEPQRTNILLNSETLATQSVTVTAQPYTLSFYGGGTVVLSGTHSATVVGLGTARKTYTFTPTAGTLTLTVTGTCTKAQFEAGSYATSYIPTIASSVTRNADLISKTGISSLIGQTEGTVFVDINVDLSYTQVDMRFINVSDGTSTNWWFIGTNVSNQIRFYFRASGTVYVSELVTLTSGRHKLAFAYKSNDYVAYVDGIQVHSLNSLIVGATSRIDLGNDPSGGKAAKQFINSAILFKERLSDAELAQLTTI